MSDQISDWRDASMSPVVPGTTVHASCLTPAFFVLLNMTSWVTWALVFLAIVLVSILSMKGRSIAWIVRRTLSRMRRQTVQARPAYYLRRTRGVISWDDIPNRALNE